MRSEIKRRAAFSVVACAMALGWGAPGTTPVMAGASAPQTAAPSSSRQIVGTIKAIGGTMLTVAPDAGAEVKVEVRQNARLLRVAPGETNLANAAALSFGDLQVGDRLLIQATPGADTQSLVALRVIAMKKTDVEAKQEADRLDWQRRGVAGLVTAVDPASGVVTISTGALTGGRTTAIRTTSDTTVRRYAPDSVQFDDALPSAVAQIKVGDQIRARGVRSPDGSGLTAEEIVAGSFRNIAGVISSLDAGANTITVNDLATKKPVVVRVTAQSQVRKLTPEAAQGLASRARAAGAGGAGAGAAAPNAGRRGGAGRGAGEAGRAGRGGAENLQQVVSQMPPATLADFAKGQAVMVLSTEGSAEGVTAITLLGGVEPILTAPGGNQQTLAPWDLGGGGGGGGDDGGDQ